MNFIGKTDVIQIDFDLITMNGLYQNVSDARNNWLEVKWIKNSLAKGFQELIAVPDIFICRNFQSSKS